MEPVTRPILATTARSAVSTLLVFAAFAELNAQSRCGGRKPSRIAFIGQQNSVRHIYIMDIDASVVGYNPTRLTSDNDSEIYPFWSPDGTQIVYARLHSAPPATGSNQPPPRTDVRIMNADGTGDHAVSRPSGPSTANWCS